MHKLVKIIITLAVVYVFLGVLIFFSGNHLVYHPAGEFGGCDVLSDYKAVEYKGTRFYYKNQSESVVVYYHGNAGSACDRGVVKDMFGNNSVIFVEYSGYGEEGTPSREKILEDVENVNEFIEHEEVFVYGESIGSGPASYHASIGDVEGVVLVSPFSSLRELARSKLPVYPGFLWEDYNNVKWLRGFEGDVLILHGSEDKVVPPRLSEKLHEQIPSERVVIEGRGHNDIWRSDEFKERVGGFV